MMPGPVIIANKMVRMVDFILLVMNDMVQAFHGW